jgi:hypothetical protein
MIPLGTQLRPRNPSDPVVKVCGVSEPDRYTLAPVEFGTPVFAMGYDEVTAAYICDGHAVAIEVYDEQAEWRKLSAETYHGKVAQQLRNAKKAAELPTPEQVFAAQDAEAAEKPRGRRK